MLRALLVSCFLLLPAVPAMAADCELSIDATDQMTFSTDRIQISKSCPRFTVTLHHVGQLSKDVMGHNWVMTRAADERNVAMDGMGAGAANGYVRPGDDRVIAATRLLGGGESASVTFDTAGLSSEEKYLFFCSFPGHVAMMRGTVELVD